ncbi:MAG: PocR ligand-binding domain-containing protein [Lachnospiraceae bacterium]|nr:PocR ligand-binding domain-containing protein [Lachnospiraceae bacterium]
MSDTKKRKQYNIKLVDLIEPDVLQRIQDSFSKTVGMAAIITEADGKPVTKGANFTEFCARYTRCSELGNSMCEECDRYGAEVSLQTGKFSVYTCHSGLMEFAAPIVIEGHMVGCFVGGQVLCEPPDEETVRETAAELGINPDRYWESIQKVPVLDRQEVDKAAEFLHTMAGVMSDMAYGKYLSMIATSELERAAKMQGDFLANMSHEIRTPMNAVIGFAEMALRENLPPNAADYIRQIKNSGKALLTIINDILDYSKIEAGKMELVPVEYEPLSLIDDVANIIMTRLVDKDVELLIDVNPNIPRTLIGDNVRIRQILINLCNNATKFTNEGYVKVRVDYEWMGYEKVLLHFDVIDTGIGIKEADLEKIFNSFQQVDSRRNRNIEGTGLGLTICRMLLQIMGSELKVESTYGEGSTFSFSVQQDVADSMPSIIVEDADQIALGTAIDNPNVIDDFINDAAKLGIDAHLFRDFDNKERDMAKWLEENGPDKRFYFFLEQKYFDPGMFENMKQGGPKVTAVVLADTFADLRSMSKYEGLMFLRKPVSVLNLGNLFNNNVDSAHFESTDQDALYSFTAESVKALVVDDNIVNLTVAQGLLEPLKAQVDGAISGKEALRMMESNKYDIIFMDHMMPEMDGIDATKIIRQTMPEYNDVPIIALTANAVSGAKEMFLDAGMNDFVAKPIEVRSLIEIFRRYIPQDKIDKISADVKNENIESSKSADNINPSNKLVIADLDTDQALKMLGSEKLYMNIIKSYYDAIDMKAKVIREYYDEHDWPQYAIEVHALKSSSRQIGATELGELAYKLEMASKAEEIDTVTEYTDELLERYTAYKDKLAYLFDTAPAQLRAADKPEATLDSLKSLFGRMRVAVDDLDMDEMEKIIEEMGEFKYNDFWQEKYEQLQVAVAAMDVDSCIEILNDWK